MRKYEIMYILDESTKDLKALQSKLHEILENNGGEIKEKENWGVKNFSYPIKKKISGFYSVLIVNTTKENINEFIRVSHIEKEILRTMIINTEKEKRYIQSTKFAKNEIKNEKQERDDYKIDDKKFDKSIKKNNSKYE